MATHGRPQLPNPLNPPYDEGAFEEIDPATGRDIDEIPTNGIEMMTPIMPDRDQGTTHEGDMGRLGK